jgi:hypothetical protein
MPAKILSEIRRWNERYDLGLEGLLPKIGPEQAEMALQMVEDFLDRKGAKWLQQHPADLWDAIESRLGE